MQNMVEYVESTEAHVSAIVNTWKELMNIKRNVSEGFLII